MGKCVAFPFVKTKDGMKRSKFFMDLLHYGRTREQAKEDYFVGTNEEFLRLARDVAEFDENGEITYESYNNLVGVDTSEENLLKILEKDAKVGTYSYGEAVTRLQQFNKHNPHKKDYLATLELDDSGNKYHLRVVKRTPAAEAALELTLRHQHIQNSIIDQLRNIGVAVDFLENPGDIEGRYSTVNAEQTNDSLYHLIQISKGKDDISTTLAEEAGHFAVGALGHNPLVIRLQQALSNEQTRTIAFEKILDEDPSDRVLGNNPAREAAGILVGRALIDEAMGGTFLDHMINRIVSLAKKTFAKLTFNSAKLNLYRAEDYARRIAAGFMSSDFQGNVEEALKTKETLYEARKGTASRTYKSIVGSITRALRELQATDRNSKLSKLTTGIVKESVKDGRITAIERGDIFSTNLAMDGIIAALTGYVDLIGEGKEITEMIRSIDLMNDSSFFPNMAVYGRKLNEIRTFIDSGQRIIAAINMEFNSQLADTTAAEGAVRRMRNLTSQLQDALNIIAADLVALERDYFCRYCEQIYGQKYVETSRRLVFIPPTYSKDDRGKSSKDRKKSKVLQVEEGQKIRFAGYIDENGNYRPGQIDELKSDISTYERLFASMSNNSDIIGQVADLTTRKGRAYADEATNSSWDYLKVLNERWAKLKLGRDQSILFEKDENGEYTGNIISDLNWGKWEKERKELIDDLKRQFREDNKDTLASMTEVQASMQFEEMYLKPALKDWNYNHSYWNAAASRWEPSSGQRHSRGGSREDYTNYQFKAMMDNNPTLKEWYDDYMNMKWDLDKQLPPGATLPYRAPQFRGTLVNRMRNREEVVGKRKALGFGMSLRRFALDSFCETGEDYDFGCMGTLNALEDDLYRDETVIAANQPRRIPIFGVNKIKDTKDLSTDLAYSTLCYASMSHSYEQLNKSIDALKVGQNALLNRDVGRKQGKAFDTKTEKEWARDTGEYSQSYRRYIDFIDKVVYGISVKPELSGSLSYRKYIPEKMVSFLTRLGTYMFLGFNYVGGFVNTGTGLIEIFKESMVKDFINPKSVTFAHRMYFLGDNGLGGIVDNWMDWGKLAKDNKVSLFCREFDVDSKNAHRYKDWKTTHSRLFNWFAAAPFLGYSSGDHYMQSISYIALAYDVKLYDEDGKETDLFHAYKLVDNVDDKGNVKGKTLKLGTYFKSREAIEEHKLITKIEEKLANSNRASMLLGGGVNFTQEEQEYLDAHGINAVNVDNAKVQLKNLKNNLIWGEADKTKFQMKAREINNRLHGIYDRQNSVGFSSKWWGNALLSMRGWMLGWAQRRFAPDHYSMALGQNVEGSAITFAKTILYSFGGPKEDLGTLRQRLGRLGLILAMGGYGKSAKAMEMLGLSEFQQGNIRRNTMDTLIMILLAIVKGMTAQPPKEERDKWYEPDVTMGRWHYLSGRLLLEQGAFSWQWPLRIKSEMQTTLNLIPPGASAGFDIIQLMYEMTGVLWANKDNSDIYYQKSEPGKYEEEDPKWLNHIMKYTPLRNAYTWEQPYKAYDSYESFTLNKRR